VTFSSHDPSTLKHVQVTCLHKLASSLYGFGLIGVYQNSFCLKSKNNCNVSSHSQVRFDPKLDHYCINKNQNGDHGVMEVIMVKIMAMGDIIVEIIIKEKDHQGVKAL
jgi:hypothetical protein